jgi:hypothetical protein
MNAQKLKSRLRPLKRTGANAIHRFGIPLRRQRYVDGRHMTVLRRGSPGRLLELSDETAVGSRRIEIGCGAYPRQGFIHVDIDPDARHLEYLRPAWNLPFPDDWASEISSIHALEHISPALLNRTLREWHRVLAPWGRLHVSVPNTPNLMRKFLTGSQRDKWLMSAALLGMYCGPDAHVPASLTHAPAHRVLFDYPLLSSVLAAVGFTRITDQTSIRPDRHAQGWREVVDDYSLVVTAAKQPNRLGHSDLALGCGGPIPSRSAEQ